jgi:hypothetical protein
MQIKADNIFSTISKINIDTTDIAHSEFNNKINTSRIKPFTSAYIKFISSFFKNENKYNLFNRFINSYLASFSEFIKQLKLLKLNNKF